MKIVLLGLILLTIGCEKRTTIKPELNPNEYLYRCKVAAEDIVNTNKQDDALNACLDRFHEMYQLHQQTLEDLVKHLERYKDAGEDSQ